jgi:hypothetical protein
MACEVATRAPADGRGPNKWLERTSLRRHGSCEVWLATAPPPPLAAQPHRSPLQAGCAELCLHMMPKPDGSESRQDRCS